MCSSRSDQVLGHDQCLLQILNVTQVLPAITENNQQKRHTWLSKRQYCDVTGPCLPCLDMSISGKLPNQRDNQISPSLLTPRFNNTKNPKIQKLKSPKNLRCYCCYATRSPFSKLTRPFGTAATQSK